MNERNGTACVRSMALTAVLVLLFALTVVEVYGFWTLRSHGLAAPIVSVADIALAQGSDIPPHVLSRMAEEFRGDDPQQILEQVMNKVRAIGPSPPGDALTILESADQGQGQTCDGMATLYEAALEANGIPARRIALFRNLAGIQDSHVTTEALVDGRWVLYDPTFNVSFVRNGTLVSAREIQIALLDGHMPEIKPVFHGEVAYPARLQDYYMDWPALFNNPFVMRTTTESWKKLPPLRHLVGSAYYRQPIPDHRADHVQFFNRLCLLFNAILPTVLTALGMTAVALSYVVFIQPRRHRRFER